MLLLIGVCIYQKTKQNRETVTEDDVNPVYATYEVDADPVAEVVDHNADYFAVEDSMWEGATRTKDNNSQYSSV